MFFISDQQATVYFNPQIEQVASKVGELKCAKGQPVLWSVGAAVTDETQPDPDSFRRNRGIL